MKHIVKSYRNYRKPHKAPGGRRIFLTALLTDWLIGEVFLAGLTALCYRAPVWMAFLQVLLFPWFYYRRRQRKNQRIRRCRQGFLSMMQSLMTSLQAGYALKNACRRSYEELREIYDENRHPFMPALRDLILGLDLNLPPEKVFHEFAVKTGLREMHQLAVVMEIAMETGGDMVKIIRNAMEHMQTRMEAEQEIHVLLSGKIYEKNIMAGMPFMIILYLRIANPGYLDVFYESWGGHILMCVLLGAVILCFFWSERIIYRCMT